MLYDPQRIESNPNKGIESVFNSAQGPGQKQPSYGR